MKQQLQQLKKSTLFLLLTFGVNWLMIGIYALAGGTLQPPWATGVLAVYMLVPALVAIFIEKYVHEGSLRKLIGISSIRLPWLFAAWLCPILIMAGAFAFSLPFPGIAYDPEMHAFKEQLAQLGPEAAAPLNELLEKLPVHLVWLSLGAGLLAGITINAFLGLGEELGWRGLLLQSYAYMSFWNVSLVIGFIWGLWHAPLILMGHNYPEHPVMGVLMMIGWCILLTPLFIYVTLKAGSVLAAAILHGTINALAGMPLLVLSGGNDLTRGATGFPGFITLLVITLLLYLYDRFVAKEPIMTGKLSDR